MPPGPLRLVLAVLVLLALAAVSGCRGCARAPDERAVPLPPAPPARPTELIAEWVVPEPTATWRALRPLLGGPASFLPAGPEVALATVLGLDTLSAGAFDLSRPVVGGVALPEQGPAELVAALPLTSGDELVARLSTGSAATHRRESRGPLALLLPAGAAAARTYGVVDATLLVGARAGLERSAEYLARTSAKRRHAGPPRLDVEPRALGRAGETAWAAQRTRLAELAALARARHGRPADFAEPAAVLAGIDELFSSWLGEVRAAESAHLTLTPAAGQLRIEAHLEHAAPRAISRGRDRAPALAELPVITRLAFASERDAGARGASALAVFARAVFGQRLREADAAELERVLGKLESARGDRQVLGWLAGSGLLWTGDVKDAEQWRRAVGELLAAAVRSPWAEPLTALAGQPRLVREPAKAAADGSVIERYRVRFVPVAKRASEPADAAELEVVVWAEAERFLLLLAPDVEPALDAVLAARAGKAALGTFDTAARLLETVDRAAPWAVWADAGLLTGGAGAPLVASVVPSEQALVLRVEVSSPALERLTTRLILP